MSSCVLACRYVNHIFACFTEYLSLQLSICYQQRTFYLLDFKYIDGYDNNKLELVFQRLIFQHIPHMLNTPYKSSSVQTCPHPLNTPSPVLYPLRLSPTIHKITPTYKNLFCSYLLLGLVPR